MKTAFRINQAVALAAIGLVFGGSNAFGQLNRTWVGTTDANWGTASNRDAAAVPASNNGAFFNGAGNGNATIQITDGSPSDTVIVTIPKNGAPTLFARLKVVQAAP